MLIELHCINRWVVRLDYEGLVAREGTTKAEKIWDTVSITGEYRDAEDMIYIRAATLLQDCN